MIVEKGQVPKLDWFKDARHELVVHTECTTPESLIDELVGDRCDSANTVIVKYDDDLHPHALIVNNRMTQRRKTDEHVFSLFAAASQCSHPSMSIIATEKTGIGLHRRSSDKPVGDPLSPLLIAHKGARMFPMPELLDSQKDVLKRFRKNPGNEVKLSARNNEINFTTRIFIERLKAISGEAFQQMYPKSTVQITTSDEYLPILLSHGCGIITDKNGPFLLDVEEYDQHLMRNRYLADRDSHRAAALIKMKQQPGQTDYWETSSMLIAGKVFQRVKHTAARPFITRIVYDKHATGRNMWKQTGNEVDAQCKLCKGGMKDQQHPQIKSTREHHWAHIERELAVSNPESRTSIFTKRLHSIVKEPENYELLIGRTHSHNKVRLSNLFRNYDPQDRSWLSSAMVRYFRHVANMAISIYSTR